VSIAWSIATLVTSRKCVSFAARAASVLRSWIFLVNQNTRIEGFGFFDRC